MAPAPDRETTIATATKYLDALVSHDARDVPLAPDAWRVEQGRNSGIGADDIRARTEAPNMHIITGRRDLRWFVDGEQAVAFYLLDTTRGTVYIAERFCVVEGMIHEIEAIFHISEGTHEDRWPLDPTQLWTADHMPGQR